MWTECGLEPEGPGRGPHSGPRGVRSGPWPLGPGSVPSRGCQGSLTLLWPGRAMRAGTAAAPSTTASFPSAWRVLALSE